MLKQNRVPEGYDTFTSDPGASQLALEAQAGHERPKESGEEGATAGSAFVNLWNSILCGGVSMLPLPAAAHLCGVYIFPFVVLATMLFAGYTADLLVVGYERTETRDYASFVSHALGPSWAMIMDLLLFTFSVTGCPIILEGAVDSALPVLQGAPTLWVIVGAGIATFLSLVTNSIDSLAPISTFSFILVNLFLCAMVWDSGAVMSSSSLSVLVPLWPSSFTNLISGTSIICFSWIFHYNVIPVFSELQAPQRQTWLRAMPPALFVSAICFLLCGLLPTFTYPGSKLTLFAMYAHSTLGKMTSLLFGVSFIILLPLVAFVGSRALLSLATMCWQRGDARALSESSDKIDPPRHVLQWAIVAFYVLVLAFALAVPSLDMVVKITGTITGVPIMFIIPPMAFASVSRAPSVEEGETWNWMHSFSLACVATIAGVLLWVCLLYCLFVN